MTRHRRFSLLLYPGLLLSLALAFFVRVSGLSAQSLWNDEGTSVALSHLSLSAIASGAAHDIHPPLYYFLLHFWLSLAGDSEFAVRLLSVLFGLLLVAITTRLARDLFSWGVALVAAGLSALSAFQLYYSQEARMYILVALWGALSILALVRILFPPAREGQGENGVWVLYILSTLAALYTHYYAPTLILVENLALIVWLALVWRTKSPRVRRTLALWIDSQFVIALAFLPWLLYAGNQLASWPAIGDRFSLPELTGRILNAFVLGIDTPLGYQVWIVAAFGLLFLLGLLPVALAQTRRAPKDPLGLRQHASVGQDRILSYWPVLLAALWAFAPLAFMFVASFQRPTYNPKFLLLATPGFYLLVARGLALIGPGLAHSRGALGYARVALLLIGCGIVGFGTSSAVQGVYSDPRLQRDDYRGVISYINALARENDAVLVDAPGQMDVFRYYYHGAAPVFTLPVGRPMDREATDHALQDAISRPGNIFAVYWATEQADPEHYVELRLSSTRFKALDEWHGNIRLDQYGSATDAAIRLIRAPVRFGDEIELQQAERFASTPVPGRVLPFQFTWQALVRPAGNYKVFVHLVDAHGNIVGQRDTEPVDGLRPTATWNAGETIADKLGLVIRPGTPPGDYTLEMGLYRPEDGSRLAVSTGGDHLTLGVVHIDK